MPKASVIIPSYNHSAFVRQCIDSVLVQTFRDYEIVVVDDGSTDGSLDILRGYGDRIRLICQQNRGTQAARNSGIAASSGEFIAILDSDDAWLPEKLERQMEVFERRPEVGLVYSFAEVVDADGATRSLSWHLGRPVVHPQGALAQLLLGCDIPALTAVIHRRCLEAVGGFDETLLGSGDWDLWIRIAAQYPVACVEERLALYRTHTTNTTKALFLTKAVCAEHERVLAKAFELPAVRALPPQIRDQALARVRLSGAEAEAMRGEAAGIGRELKRAVELDPALLEDPAQLGDRLISWMEIYAAESTEADPFRRFDSAVLGPLSDISPAAPEIRRRVLSHAAMSRVFSAHVAGNATEVRRLLPTGVRANPRWLLNPGVWSIAVEAYLGPKVAAVPRRLARWI